MVDWHRATGKAAARWRRRQKRWGGWRLTEWAKANITAGPNHTLMVRLG